MSYLCDILKKVVDPTCVPHEYKSEVISLQVSRLFEIIYILLNKESITTKELAAQFGVSMRTIRRDIDTLSLAGIPIYTQKGKGGGVSLLPNFVLNKSILSDHEQNEILTALHGLAHIKVGDANDVLNRLSTIFNKTAANWLEVDFSDWDNSNDFNSFKTAILKHRIALFDYYNSYGEKTFRRVEPMQLLFKHNAWYLKAFCLTKQGIRLYKLTRINNLVVTNEHFLVRALLSSISDDDAQTAQRERSDITIKLRIAPEMAYRVFDDFADDMIDKQPDGSFIVTRTYPEDNWVYSYVLSFGKYAEVLEPKHLQEIIKAETQNILAKYL